MIKKIISNTIVILVLAVIIGILTGLFIPKAGMKSVLVLKQISGQVIFFLVPMIIIGFVAPSIASLKGNVSRLIVFAFLLAYLSSVGAAFFAMLVGYQVMPLLDIRPVTGSLRELPEVLFNLEIPPMLSVMSALLFSVFIGLGCIWINSKEVTVLLLQFREIVLQLVKRILIPLLPLYVAANFCSLSYEGDISRLGIFLPVILIVIACHYLWLLLLYGLAAVYSGKNSWQVLKFYLPAYLTALGTMSSAATLGVALECAHKSPVLDKKVSDFSIPLFANIHLCGSVLTEVFFVCVVSQLLYGQLPELSTLVLFIFLLGVLAVGAPGVPGGTVLASLGIVISVLGFDDAGTALLIAIFALQDSFGTACNITGDGALTLITDTFMKRHSPFS
ncbi:cation:dicarboxylate symporter family transporter [Parabacteroides massiliensis]|nr:cation:dicarboxylase symporter family transporter [Parabacteroides massiliensis]